MDMTQYVISIYEPFSDFLLGEQPEKEFKLSLLDTVRFAGHACPSMVGAFLISQKAIEELFPETNVCVRGQLRIDIPRQANEGPTGPTANVFGFITGAWAETGFGGLQGRHFVRRNLLRFGVEDVPLGSFRFTRIDNGASVLITIDSSKLDFESDASWSFQQQWRVRIQAMLEQKDAILMVERTS